ncbi:MAG TPA: fimbrial protein [Scandinavium sp.]|jgi:type 1 fimbria pilin
MTNVTGNAVIGPVTVAQDTPVGTVVVPGTVINVVGGGGSCSGTYDMDEGFSIDGAEEAPGFAGQGVYQIPGVEGLGVRIYYSLPNIAGFNDISAHFLTSPKETAHVTDGFAGEFSANFSVEIIVTGPVTGGTANLSALGNGGIWFSGIEGISLQLSNFQVTVPAPTCDVESYDETVNLTASEGVSADTTFTGVNSTSQSVPFNINLNCNEGVNVDIVFSGTANSDNTILQLDNTEDSASGIGIQILDSSSHVIPLNLPEDTPYELIKNVPQGAVPLQFNARYIQTESNVTSGRADATATFKIIYR